MFRYLADLDGVDLNADTFDLDEYLTTVDPRLLQTTEGRRALTRYDPLLFVLLYLPHMIRSEETGDKLSINELNLILFRQALQWIKPRDNPMRKRLRQSFLAPRNMGKSTTVQCLLLWAMCHKHASYIILFSGSDEQVTSHMSAVRRELAENPLFKQDYPLATYPLIREDQKSPDADRANKFTAANHVTIQSRSIWSSILGAKEGRKRPDLIIIDDMSKGEGQGGTANDAAKQIDVLLGTIFPLNLNAPVWMIGTNHFNGSVEDQLKRSTLGEDFKWVKEERIEVTWVKPIVDRPDGTQRSVFPALWSLEFLLSISGNRSFSKDFMNTPVPAFEGMGFTQEDFIVTEVPSYSLTILSVDPGVSVKGDPTGLVVMSYSKAAGKIQMREALPVRLKGMDLKGKIMELCRTYDVNEIVWEDNQGGESLVDATLGRDFALPVHLIHAKEDKLVRAELLLTRYKKQQIVHAKPLPAYESECKSFPGFIASPNMVDAAGHGVEYLAKRGSGQAPVNTRVLHRR